MSEHNKMRLILSYGSVFILNSFVLITAQAENEQEANKASPLIETFGKITHDVEHTSANNDGDVNYSENQDLSGKVAEKNAQPSAKYEPTDNFVIENKEYLKSTLESGPKINQDVPTEIPDNAKDEIIKDFLLKEMHKPLISSGNVQHEDKLKVLRHLLSNVLSNTEDLKAADREEVEATSSIKADEEIPTKNNVRKQDDVNESNNQVLNLNELNPDGNEMVTSKLKEDTVNESDRLKDNNEDQISIRMGDATDNLNSNSSPSRNDANGQRELPLESDSALANQITSSRLALDDVSNNLNKKENDIESKTPEKFMDPKMMAVPLILNNGTLPQNSISDQSEPNKSSDLTLDQIKSMSDQDILEKLEENNTINPDILKRFNNDPEVMKEILSAPQQFSNIDYISDSIGKASGTNLTNNYTLGDIPVAELLAHNPFEDESLANSSGVDTRVLKSMSDAELQVALIALLASMNPAQTNQINLKPTGYGTFLTYIGDIDLNIELVPIQSNPLTRKKAKDMFKEVSKALIKIHSKLPPGTDEVVKAVISATVPGGSEAIEAAELVADIVKKQKEAKKENRNYSPLDNA